MVQHHSLPACLCCGIEHTATPLVRGCAREPRHAAVRMLISDLLLEIALEA